MKRLDANVATVAFCAFLLGSFCAVHAEESVQTPTRGRLSAAYYVQDGLVLHFDGIENAGLGMPHDSSTTVWKDLSKTANDANIEKSTTNEGDLGGWLENGYRFAGYSAAVTKSTQEIAPNLKATIQTVTTFNPADQRANYSINNVNYKFYPSIFGTDKERFYIYTEQTSSHLYAKLGSAKVTKWSWNGRYATVLQDSGASLLFETDVSNEVLVPGSSMNPIGEYMWCIGSARVHNNQYGYYCAMTGAVHSVRTYSRILTNDELKWNRIIDDYRFFGVKDKCLPTNAVVVVSSDEGCGGVDSDDMYLPVGWTFLASSDIKMEGDKGYVASGYVLETWDDAAKTWTNPVTNLQSTAWMSPASGNWPSVRLTWLAKVVRGVISVPDVGDYVQEGLLLHLDGLRNVGADKPHDSAAAIWRDLAGGASAAITHHAEGDSSAWTNDGYFFGGKTVAIMDNSLTLSKTATVQVACNSIDISAQTSKYPTIMGLSGTKDRLNIYWNSTKSLWYFKVSDYIAVEKGKWTGDYLTAIFADKNRALFDTATPSWGTWSYDVSVGTITPIFGGGRGHFTEPYTDWYLVGEIKNVRIYDRVLSDAEFEKNREIDEARRAYLPDVQVADGVCGASVEEPGLYHVQGEWTFSATNVVDKFGSHRTVVGYTLETAQNGVWSESQQFSGSTYTHKKGFSPKFVRLVWRLSPRGMRIVLQ